MGPYLWLRRSVAHPEEVNHNGTTDTTQDAVTVVGVPETHTCQGTGMVEPRKRRIGKRSIVAVTASVLLLAGYLSAYFGWCFGVGAGKMPIWANRPAQIVFAPIDVYCRCNCPGARQINSTVTWALNAGMRSRGFNPDGTPLTE